MGRRSWSFNTARCLLQEHVLRTWLFIFHKVSELVRIINGIIIYF
jgi:hypothetical protein